MDLMGFVKDRANWSIQILAQINLRLDRWNIINISLNIDLSVLKWRFESLGLKLVIRNGG